MILDLRVCQYLFNFACFFSQDIIPSNRYYTIALAALNQHMYFRNRQHKLITILQLYKCSLCLSYEYRNVYNMNEKITCTRRRIHDQGTNISCNYGTFIQSFSAIHNHSIYYFCKDLPIWVHRRSSKLPEIFVSTAEASSSVSDVCFSLIFVRIKTTHAIVYCLGPVGIQFCW